VDFPAVTFENSLVASGRESGAKIAPLHQKRPIARGPSLRSKGRRDVKRPHTHTIHDECSWTLVIGAQCGAAVGAIEEPVVGSVRDGGCAPMPTGARRVRRRIGKEKLSIAAMSRVVLGRG